MESPQYVCPICQDEIFLTENELITICGHGFHTECIWTAINNKSICPICRCELPYIIKYNITLYNMPTNSPSETMEYMSMDIDIENLKQAIKIYFPKISQNYVIINNENIITKNEDILGVKPIGESPNFFIIDLFILNNFDGSKIAIKNIINEKNNSLLQKQIQQAPQLSHLTQENINQEQTIFTMSHKDFMAYCNRKLKTETKKVKIEIPTGLTNSESSQLDAFVIKKLKSGMLVQLEKPYCIGIITHSGPSLPRRFYFITSNGNICSMSNSFETSKKLLRTTQNIDYTYPGIHIVANDSSDVIKVIKN